MQPTIKIIRAPRKTIVMTVEPDKTVLVKAPLRASQSFITEFIKNHESWIAKQLKRQPEKPTKDYQNGEEFLFLGVKHTLEIGNYPEISVENGTLFFPKFLEFRIQKQLTSWYIHQAKKIITRQVEEFSEIMDKSYTGLAFSDTSSKWGSCSPDNHLQFNWRLVMAPIVTINYVVIHELAHTKEKNHSQKFWDIVEKYIPSYRIQRKWLNKHSNLLIV